LTSGERNVYHRSSLPTRVLLKGRKARPVTVGAAGDVVDTGSDTSMSEPVGLPRSVAEVAQ
jgi:hypothetical protein